jgi:TonB family protein
MPTDAIGNLAIYSLQIAAIIAGASILPWALKLDNAGARYAYWRAIGVLCLVLPWVQPYKQLESRPSSVVDSAAVNAVAASTRNAGADMPVDWVVVILSLFALGAMLRLSWLGLGLYKLRSLRLSGSGEPAIVFDADLQRTLGTRADIRHASAVDHPVTFGLLRPVVLLPETLRDRSPEIRRAVVAHELVHVKRRDWTWLVVEEVVVCLLWFHPAVWWLVSRIQLAREEVVDELAILVTGRRKAYIEALLAFADSTSVLPIAAFARRRHLFRRIALVSKEDVMSSRRIVASCAAMALVVVTGSWLTVSAFPLRGAAAVLQQQAGPGPLERRARTVTPENPIPRRVQHEVPQMPDIPGVTGGTLVVQVTLDEVGRVAEARVIEIAVKGPNFNVGFSGNDLASQFERTGSGMPADAAAAMRQALPAFVESALVSVRGSRYDPPAEGPLTFSVPVRIGAAPEIMAFQPAGNAPRAHHAFTSTDNALRVGGGIKPPMKMRDVRPVYPAIAREANVSGVVILEIRIGIDGGIEDAHVLRSIPLLDQAALDAVKQWKFKPTLLNGQPVPIFMTTTINFTLPDQQ